MAEQENNGACSSESCSGCAHADSCASKKVDMTVPANEYTHVKKVIGVISGKGGVGKSMVTASLARLMREQGYSVGILDADITGPSIPKMYGIHEHAMGTEVGMFPCIAKDETRIMSVNLLLDSEDTPVIWRGPVIAGVVKQFYTDVLWEELLIRRYATGNRGCAIDSVPVFAGRWSGHRDIAAGSCSDDCEKDLLYGKTDEYSDYRSC